MYMKRNMIIILVLIFAVFNAYAQLGITRDGKLKNITATPFHFDNALWAPKFLPKTKMVKIKVEFLKYNFTNDEWYTAWSYFYKLHYDTLGEIQLIEKMSGTDREKSWEIKYNDKKVSSFWGYGLKYDQNGYWTKMTNRDEIIWRITWTSQGYLSTVYKKYDIGLIVLGGNFKYEITQNGRNVKKLNLDNNGVASSEYLKVYDTHDVPIKIVYFNGSNSEVVFYDNKYDDNGNLKKRLPYEKVNGEKEYVNGPPHYGYLYEYEYEFYQDDSKELINQDTESTKKIFVDLGLPSGTKWMSENEEGFYNFDDAVKKFGDKLPSNEQLIELKDNCSWTWSGKGYEVIGPNGKSIFLPASGYRYCNGNVNYVGSDGRYWSSTPYGSDDAWFLSFNADGVRMHYGNRCYGRSVRLVQD